jgi:hypothetical protein
MRSAPGCRHVWSGVWPRVFGRENREAIIARETTIIDGLRAINRAYHAALEPMPAPEFSKIIPAADKAPNHELELE